LTGTPVPFTLEGMDKVAEGLDRIGRAFEKHNEIAQAQLEAMPKPKHKAESVLETIALVVGILAVIGTAETVRRWLTGG